MGLGADLIVDTGMKRCVVDAKCTKLLCISQQECANTVHVRMGNGQANAHRTVRRRAPSISEDTNTEIQGWPPAVGCICARIRFERGHMGPQHTFGAGAPQLKQENAMLDSGSPISLCNLPPGGCSPFIERLSRLPFARQLSGGPVR